MRFNAFPDALHWLTENPHALVELTLVSDEYMTAEERKSLYDTHSGIVTLIPAVRNAKVLENEEPHLDLSLPIEELFKSYFKARHKQDPNEEIMQLFKEIRAEEKE